MSCNNGLQSDPLFVAITRPAMRWGVTMSGMLIGGVITAEMFIWTHNLLWLLSYIPIHGLLALLLMAEPRYFDLLTLWVRTKGLNRVFGSYKYWKASSYTPLRVDLSNPKGIRKLPPQFTVSNSR